jgi:hypothetical protein
LLVNISYSKKNSAGIIINVHTSSCKGTVIIVLFEGKLIFLDRFSKIIQIPNFMKIHPVRASSTLLIHRDRYRWTDWDLTKPVVVLFNMAARLKLLMKKRRWAQVAAGSYVIVWVVQIVGGRHLMNRNCVREKCKSTLKWENAWYHSVQNPLSSCLLSNNTKIKIYRATVLSVILYGCETSSLTMWEEYRVV